MCVCVCVCDVHELIFQNTIRFRYVKLNINNFIMILRGEHLS